MILRLDPRIPMLWRDPFTLQFGVEPERVVVQGVTRVEERLLASLRVGVTDSGLAMVAETAGGTPEDASALVSRLGPVMDRPRPRAGARVDVVGASETAELVADILAGSGARVTLTDALREDEDDPRLAIAVGHYVLDPELYSHWLRRDIPHLPVLFGDATATVGPLVEPGIGPCLHCIEFHRRDADPRWAALSAQLWGKRSAAETALVSREAAALAARLALERLRRPGRRPANADPMTNRAPGTSYRIDVETGEITRTEWLPHPDCGCRALDSL